MIIKYSAVFLFLFICPYNTSMILKETNLKSELSGIRLLDVHYVGSRDKNVIETMPNTITSSISVKYTAKNIVINIEEVEDALTIYNVLSYHHNHKRIFD